MKPYTANRSCDPGACRHPRNATITPNTDVLWWLIKRVLDKPFSDIMRERIWSKLGTERDTSWVVGPTTVEASGSRLITTLRDMARFGQMMLQKGRFNGQQIVPIAVVEDIEYQCAGKGAGAVVSISQCSSLHGFLLKSMAKSPTGGETFTSPRYFPTTIQAKMLDQLLGT